MALDQRKPETDDFFPLDADIYANLNPAALGIFKSINWLFSKRSVLYRLAFCVLSLAVSLLYIHRTIGQSGAGIFGLLIFWIWMKEWSDVTLKWGKLSTKSVPG